MVSVPTGQTDRHTDGQTLSVIDASSVIIEVYHVSSIRRIHTVLAVT